MVFNQVGIRFKKYVSKYNVGSYSRFICSHKLWHTCHLSKISDGKWDRREEPETRSTTGYHKHAGLFRINAQTETSHDHRNTGLLFPTLQRFSNFPALFCDDNLNHLNWDFMIFYDIWLDTVYRTTLKPQARAACLDPLRWIAISRPIVVVLSPDLHLWGRVFSLDTKRTGQATLERRNLPSLLLFRWCTVK